jgi:PhnB protein
MKVANPYLNFAGNAEEAFEFYRSVFGGAFTNVTRFRDMGGAEMGFTGSDLDLIANIGLPIGANNVLMASDVPAQMETVNVGNNFYIALEADSAEEADRVYEQLAAGGRTGMPMQRTAWAEKYGDLTDRFGVRWMVMYTGDVQFG